MHGVRDGVKDGSVLADEAEQGRAEGGYGDDVDEAEAGVGGAMGEMRAKGNQAGVIVGDDVRGLRRVEGPVGVEGGEGGGLTGEGAVELGCTV